MRLRGKLKVQPDFGRKNVFALHGYGGPIIQKCAPYTPKIAATLVS